MRKTWWQFGRAVLGVRRRHEEVDGVCGPRGTFGGRWGRSFHGRCRRSEVTKELQEGRSIVIRATSGSCFIRPIRGQGEVYG